MLVTIRTSVPWPSGPARARSSRPHGGFTLLETALALIIVLVGVLAIVEAQGHFIRSNAWSSQEATATYLANELRERMRTLPRHDPVSGLQLVSGSGGTQLVGLGREPNEITVDDFDDIDDYHGVTFGRGGNFTGPIDAFGRIIPQTDPQGQPMHGPGGVPVPLDGWSQSVLVQKLAPFDFTTVVPWTATEPPGGTFPGRGVDQYPLRVTVTVFYQGPMDPQPAPITSISWIVPWTP